MTYALVYDLSKTAPNSAQPSIAFRIYRDKMTLAEYEQAKPPNSTASNNSSSNISPDNRTDITKLNKMLDKEGKLPAELEWSIAKYNDYKENKYTKGMEQYCKLINKSIDDLDGALGDVLIHFSGNITPEQNKNLKGKQDAIRRQKCY